MRALVKSKAQKGLWLENVPEPTPKAGEVKIRVIKTGICGTDVHIYKWDEWSQKRIPVPLILGHEIVGRIVEVGTGVRDFRPGQRVITEGHVSCGLCRNCSSGRRHICSNTVGIGIDRAGGFADFICVPAENCYEPPKDISDDLASIFDPFGNAVHATCSFDLIGEDVLITGAGPIGLMSCAISRHVGARYIAVSDPNQERLELAKKMGATVACSPDKPIEKVISELGMNGGFDVGLEMSGSPKALDYMLCGMYPGGHIALLGLLPDKSPVCWPKIIFKGITLKGIYGREVYNTWYKGAAMLTSGLDISPVISKVIPAQQFESGFEDMIAGRVAKVILDWS